MPFSLLLLSTLSFVSVITAVTLFIRLQKARYATFAALEKSKVIEGYYHSVKNDIAIVLEEKKLLQEKTEQYLRERTEAITRMEGLHIRLEETIGEREYALATVKEAKAVQVEAEKQAELARQQLEEMKQRIADWEETRKESLKIAKEVMFETGGEIFRKEAENATQKTLEQMQQILQSVASLNDRVEKSDKAVETVWRTLSSPGTAGQLSELGLENSLKAFGLEPGRDFIMQYSVHGEEFGKRLRPDAVVFLPAGNVLVIDSKASKFFLELAEVEGTELEQSAYDRLNGTMNEHVKSLASKGYKDAVKDYMRAAGKETQVRHVITVMFLHSETAVEKICKSDGTFRHRAQEAGITLSGPTGLAGLMSLAQVEISRDRQEQNYQHIIAELSSLLGYLDIALDHAAKVGKGIRSVAEHYYSFTKSVNSRLLSKARKLEELGVALPKNKQLPPRLPEYHVLSDSTPVIENSVMEDDSSTPAPLVQDKENILAAPMVL